MVLLSREFLNEQYGKDRLIELKEINASLNKITRIDSLTFKELPNLERLFLEDNDISEIEPSNLFADLTNLKVLSLFNNKLKRIDSTVFKSLVNL